MIDPLTPTAPRELDCEESLRLLGSVGVGRLVFSHRALPAIRPVNHLLHDGRILVRTHPGAPMLSAMDTVVAYEADHVGAGERIGWSVIAIGIARRVRDLRELARLALPHSWVAGEKTEVIRIEPELVTGFALDGDGVPTA